VLFQDTLQQVYPPGGRDIGEPDETGMRSAFREDQVSEVCIDGHENPPFGTRLGE
jgi:hypothetical protein